MKSCFSSPENFHFSSLLRVPASACVEIECKNSEKEGNDVVVFRFPPRVISRSRLLNGFLSFLRIPVMTAYKSGDLMNIDLLFRFTPRARWRKKTHRNCRDSAPFVRPDDRRGKS